MTWAPEHVCTYKTLDSPRLRCTEEGTTTLHHVYGAVALLCGWHAAKALAEGDDWSE